MVLTTQQFDAAMKEVNAAFAQDRKRIDALEEQIEALKAEVESLKSPAKSTAKKTTAKAA